MSRFFPTWLSFCTFTLLVNVAWTNECLRSVLQPLPRNVKLPSDCLMDCTMRTYIKKRLLHYRSSIQFKDSNQGDHGGHCWHIQIQSECRVGEIFDRAYVVLPVNITTGEPVEVTTSPAATKLSVHPSLPLIPNICGQLYDVTKHINKENTQSSFCIQLSIQQHIPGDGTLRCPPYLVVLWQTDSNQAHVQSGG